MELIIWPIATVGLTIANPNALMATVLNLPIEEGLLITRVMEPCQ